MLLLLHHLGDHGLHDGHVPVQGAANEASEQGDPVTLGEAKDEAAQRNACQADQDNWFAAIAIRNGAPHDGRESLGDGIGRDEQAGIEARISVVTVMEVDGHDVGVGQNGIERNWLGEAAYCYQAVQ